jgi:hypothetical protein
LNTTSIENILGTFVPLLSFFLLTNRTVPLDYHHKNLFYKLDVEQIEILDLSGFTEKVFEMEPGTDKLHIKYSGIDLSMTIDGGLSLLEFIKLDATGLNVTNITVDFTLQSVTAGDKVHWRLYDHSKFNFGSIQIGMKSHFLQKLVNRFSGLIAKVIHWELPKISNLIDSEIQKLNKAVAAEGPFTFDIPVLKKANAAVNLTMTEAPDFETQDLIKLYMNGLFVQNGTSPLSIDGIARPPRLQHNTSEQIWIHEDMIDSLLHAGAKTFFPYTIKSDVIAAQLKQVFQELKSYYGNDVEVALQATLAAADAKSVRFNTESGIIIGDKDDTLTTLAVICSNSTVKNHTAFELTMNLEAHVRLSIFDFVAFPNVGDIFVENTKVSKDNIGLYAHNFNTLFTNILKAQANDINMKYSQQGWPLSNINPAIGLLSGIIKDFTVNPFFFDQFMFIGFEMAADMPTFNEQKEFLLQSRVEYI